MSIPKLEAGRPHLTPASAEPSTKLSRAPAGRHGMSPLLPDPIALPQVLELLNAAFGAARPRSWGRAVPSPLCWQELAVYSLTPEGVYRYDAPRRRLELVKSEDLRAATGHALIATAPLSLVYVADFDPMQQAHAEEHGVCAGADTGSVLETVCDCCAGTGLVSMVHDRVDHARLARVLDLKPTERILRAQSVGHPAPKAAY